tara:strand:- start:69 stop:470 length:402 start_codon:yes stop_codon:yes gene_type:complete
MRSRRINYRSVSTPKDLEVFEWALIEGDSVKNAFLEGKQRYLFLREAKRYYILPSERTPLTKEEGIIEMRSIEVIQLPKSYVLVIILSSDTFLFFTDRVNPHRKLLDQVISEYEAEGIISEELLSKYHSLEGF